MPGPKPQLVALLLCERAFQEAHTGNWCVISAFDTINAPSLPLTHPGFTAFVALSDFTGNAVLQLVVRDEEGGVVKAVRGKIPGTQLGLFQGAFPFPEVEFTTAGVHTLELFSDDELITLRSFRLVSNAPDPEKEEAEANALAEEHKAQLTKDVLEVWQQHPDAQPVGMVASAEATKAPWFRALFQSAFGAPPPELPFVGMLDTDTTKKLLGETAGEAEEWLAAGADHQGRVLRVLVVTKSGFHFAVHEIE